MKGLLGEISGGWCVVIIYGMHYDHLGNRGVYFASSFSAKSERIDFLVGEKRKELLQFILSFFLHLCLRERKSKKK